MRASSKGLDLIKSFEGCAKKRSDGHLEAYPDPAHASGDPWTIGWGSTGTDIHRGTVWTQEMCDARLASDVARFAKKVEALLDGAPTTQSQFDALVSFAYNLGTGNLASSTLLRLHKAGKFAAAHDEFAKCCNAGGKRMAGLVRRRAAEAALYGSA